MSESAKRLLLRVSVKLMLLAGVAITLYALFSSIQDPASEPDHTVAPLQIPLAAVDKTRVQRLPWAGGNLILVQYPQAPQFPPDHYSRLLSPQPPSLRHGSGEAVLFLAYDRGTDMGCPLEWRPAGDRRAPYQPWPGGFRDTCRGSWFDALGRVLKNQQAGRNLAIPPYRLIAPDLLQVGVNGDNPASEK